MYLDNETHDVYNTRMARRDGATLIRIRWYGALQGPNTPVFVERKTHRKKKKDKKDKGEKGAGGKKEKKEGGGQASATLPRIDKPPKQTEQRGGGKADAKEGGGESDSNADRAEDSSAKGDSEAAGPADSGLPDKSVKARGPALPAAPPLDPSATAAAAAHAHAPPSRPPARPRQERFKLLYRDISDLLAGRFNVLARVDSLMRAEGASREAIASAVKLCTEIQGEIIARKLVPTMTTAYYRTSFQLYDSNAVRATLDCQLRMVDEKSCRHRVDPGNWYKPLDNENVKQIHEFPYAVLELKLQGETPDWVVALLESGRLIKCWKF